jgi:hypothetical protein
MDCLKNLARQAVALSRGDEALVTSCCRLVETLFESTRSPTFISNRLLAYVKTKTGVYDPYAERKATDFRQARDALGRVRDRFPDTLEGLFRLSAFGNGGDFFLERPYSPDHVEFDGDMAKITHQVYISSKIMILGDNPGDFVFDQPLVGRLRQMGKQVLYAVKEHPVQNDMSLVDVARFGPGEMRGHVISAGTDEVGIRREEMSGKIREWWEDGSMIIAKGMGNYETISEFDHERPVVYVLKVKCRTVAKTLGREVGTYIALTGGDHG